MLNKKLNKNDLYKNWLSENIDNSILFLQNKNSELKRKNEILNNTCNILEAKYNSLINENENIKKSYDELFIKIQLLEVKIINNNNKPLLLKRNMNIKTNNFIII